MLPSCQNLKKKATYARCTERNYMCFLYIDPKSVIIVELSEYTTVDKHDFYNICLMIKHRSHRIYLKETRLGIQTNYAKKNICTHLYLCVTSVSASICLRAEGSRTHCGSSTGEGNSINIVPRTQNFIWVTISS